MSVCPSVCLPVLVSAPTRTLGRRKLVRNRFTIDTDIVFDGEPGSGEQDPDTPSPESHEPLQQSPGVGGVLTGDTDRWVEEQFDLDRYEDPDDVKETDILSDDDGGDADLSHRARGSAPDARLEGHMSALSLEEDASEENPQVEGEVTEDEEEEDEQVEGEQRSEAAVNEDTKPRRVAGPLRLSLMGKQCAMSEGSMEEQQPPSQDEVIWVRREDQAATPDSEPLKHTQS